MKLKTVHFFLLFLSFLTIALIPAAFGNHSVNGPLKAISITVSGKILNDSTGKAIINHGVIIKVPYIFYTSTVYTDTSGNYSDTIHDLHGLGDTVSVSVYDCHNALHIQYQPIQSSSIIINFFICESYSPLCVADFLSELDSSSAIPNQYRFFDLSEGKPDRWLWDFGDGSTSMERNPIHIYSKPGQYKACLTISREHSGEPCSDSSCTTISTPLYFNIGGHAFTGDHPINNPVNTGDTGVAYLYKLFNNYIIASDTTTFTYLGYYSFPNLLPGDYIVKIALTSGSANAKNYIPAYYLHELYWQQSQLLSLTNANVFDFNVELTRSNDSLSGTGKISGRVGYYTQISGVYNLFPSEVLLLDSLKHPITYTLSDASGNFSFSGLPFGSYLLFVESTGKFSKFTPVRISAQNPETDSIIVEIYDHSVTGIGEIPQGIAVGGLPFPNPTEGKVNISFTVDRRADVITSVTSLQSVTLLRNTANLGPGSHTLTNDLSGFPPGIYILIVSTPEGERICTARIMKY